jgi:hypothetical protein
MQSFSRWLNQRKSQGYMLAFLLMVIPSGLLFFSAESALGSWLLLGLVIAGNLLAVVIR